MKIGLTLKKKLEVIRMWKNIKNFLLGKSSPVDSHFEKWVCSFVTVDNKTHLRRYDRLWSKASGLICTVPEYLMIENKECGYLKDDEEVMYPLENIVSIKWMLLEECDRKLPDTMEAGRKIYFTQEELEEYAVD